MAHQLPFTYLDELAMLVDSPTDPINVHMEVRVEGRLDGERLRGALREAASRHPLARARVVPAKASDPTWRFSIEEGYDYDPLEEVECGSDAEVDATRDRLVSQPIVLSHPPMFRGVLVHHDGGDRFILNLFHQAGDGIGMVRFLRSVQRAYADEEDFSPEIDLNVARDLMTFLDIPDRDERRRRMEPLKRYQREALRAGPTRLARDGGMREGGHRCASLRLGPDEMKEVEQRRCPGSTLNDVLLAGLQLTCERWNNQHGRTSGRIGTVMPINVRPREWRYDVLSNYMLFGTVSTRLAERRDFASTLRAVVGWTDAYKRTQGAGIQVVLRGLGRCPVGAKRALFRLLPDRAWDTVPLSNLGRIDPLGDFGSEGGRVVEYWFSPPASPPMAVALGAASMGEDLFISMRYRRSQFDRAAARRFMGVYRDVLLHAR